MLFRIIRLIISFFTRHKRSVVAGAATIGAVGAGSGIFNAHKAKKINRQALEIQQAAIERHERSYQETQAVLATLGELERDIIDSFEHFADTIQRIQKRPKIKQNIFSSVKLPNYEPEEIRKLSAEAQMAINGAAAAGVAGLAGLAAFGVSTLVAAPAMFAGGFVLCIKGVALKNKAVENMKQARQLEISVDEIVKFHSELRIAAATFRGDITAVYLRYCEGLRHIEELLTTKTVWEQFSRVEKKGVENTVLLARLLYTMTQTNVVIRQADENKIENINQKELEKLHKQAAQLLSEPAL